MNKVFIIVIFFSSINSNAQISNLLKSIFKNTSKSSKGVIKNESQVCLKNIVKTNDESIAILSSNKNLAKGYSLNLNNFIKKRKQIIETSIDYGTEFLSFNEKKENKDKYLFIREIQSNKNYPILHQKICKELKVKCIDKYETFKVLNGFSINGNSLSLEKLYLIYFSYSNSFAKIELNKLKQNYKTNKNLIDTIEIIAMKRNIIL
jgi:hypothetical protein